MTDREVDAAVGRMAGGDREALKAVYLAMRKPVYIVAFTLSRREEIAEEVMQDTFIAVWERADRFVPHGRGRAWVLGIAANIAKQYLHRESRYCPAEEPAEGNAASGGDAFERRIERHEQAGRLLRALSSKERDIVILHTLAGLRLSEVADSLGLPAGSVYWSFHNARRKMRRVLEQEEDLDT